ncbi:MAG: epimerase [candidate division Zixibacteria bacterium RBG_16_53_22]|nr:MAG: epimerase [candidate division Zixibacteria bacterium RBG_16_53_22]
MNVLLTGGSGFIGKNLAEHLSRKHTVLAPSHAGLELLDGERVREFFRRHDVDVVIHSAVRPGHRNARDPSHQLYNNTRMFFNLVRNASRFRKMIFLSSGAVYDERRYLPNMKEEYFDTSVPADEHGFSKYICARYVERAENIVELRLFGVFGKYEDYAIRFISNAICKTLFNLPITLRQNRRFDYLYIDDLAPIVEYFIGHDARYKCYNVTPDEAVELLTLAGKVLAVSGKDLPIVVALPGMGPEYSGDNGRLREEIPGLAFTDIDDAIAKLYGWYTANRHLINRDALLFDK